MVKQLILIAWIGLIAVTFSCSGDKGDVGPAGPAGPTGATGPKGDSGVAGEDALGARVITTDSVLSDGGGYTFGISNVSSADSSFLATAGVFVYIKSSDANGVWWYSLPGMVPFGDQSSTFNFKQSMRAKSFFVDIRPTSWSEQQDTPPARKFAAIRVILVPTSAFRANASINWKDYNAVIKALGIKESSFRKADL